MMNSAEQEKKILDFWADNEIFKKSLAKPSPQGDFVFYEGPPTANGRPGLHHILARAFKDVVCRYKTMRGFHVARKAGWDTHGLPVEIEVEKQIGISGKKDIEKFGIEEFNKRCRESVWKYKEEWEQLTSRMGYWLDLSNPYITYTNEYIESVWWILKQAWDKELLYKGHKVVPHCPRCETSLSSHEVAQGYKAVTEPSVYIKFKVTKGGDMVQPGDFLLSWTTTPWTLPGNVALTVKKDMEYVRALVGDEHFIVARTLVEAVLGEEAVVEEKIAGASIVGVEYEPLFPGAIDPGDKKAWYVVPADFVTTTDGTGIVHTAVMYGAEDYDVGMAMDLPAVHTVSESGMFLPTVTQWAGKFVKNPAVAQEIIEDMRSRGLLLKMVDYEHDYPFCWRCNTPLLYYAKDSWFIKMTAVKEELLKNADTIHWYPEHIKAGRFGEWLEGVKDWAISRERYWGTPLPIWQCVACAAYRCIGSLEELPKKMADVHRPYIDAVELVCECKGVMKRVPEVADAWLDSGSVPFAQHHYPFENKELIDTVKAYPADYIAEAIDQTRGWFYTLLAVSTFLGKGASYRNVICLGHINDAEGKKMSKSKGNVVDPWAMMDTYGADALRYHLFTANQPGEAKSFDEKNLREVSRQVIMTLMNVVSFYSLYATAQPGDDRRTNKGGRQAGGGEDARTNAGAAPKHVMDRWVVSLLHQTAARMTAALDVYDITEATRSLGDFIQELSVWYVRRSRDRFKNDETRAEAVSVLAYVLRTLAKLMAPAAPFTAEIVWQRVGGAEAESVHLADWPEIGSAAVSAAAGESKTGTEEATAEETAILEGMKVVRRIVEKAHALRAEAGVKVRQPLARLEIDEKLPQELADIVAEEVNVKEVVAGSAFKLDTTISQELALEGTLRELTRQVNSLRKTLKLTPADIKEVHYDTESELLIKVIAVYQSELLSSTRTSSWSQAAKDTLANATTIDVDGLSLTIELR